MIYRDHSIYPHIVLIDDVAYVDVDHGPTVAEVMTEIARVGEARARRLLKINEAQQKAAEAIARDSWCTPAPLAAVLPPRSRLLDPCSNPRSVVDAETRYMLEHGQNGIKEPWWALAFVNAGFSDLLPWAAKLEYERDRARVLNAQDGYATLEGACFLVNTDNSTKWWQSLTDQLPCLMHLDARQRFDPHPGVPKSTNNKPQSLIGDRAFFEACKPELFSMGEMYERTKIRSAA